MGGWWVVVVVGCADPSADPSSKGPPDGGPDTEIPVDPVDPDPTTPPADLDGDGWDADHDCDDADPDVVGRATVDGVPYGSVQDAFDAASPGSAVVVCAGTHVGPLVAPVPVDLSSSEGAEATILTADGEDPVLSVPGGSRVAGFTVRDGSGGGLVVEGAGASTVEDCVVTDNTAYEGGGLAVLGGAAVTLTRTAVTGNGAVRGGGVRVDAGSTLVLADSAVTENRADEDGGGVWLDGGTLTGGTVERNRAERRGGGLLITGEARVEGAQVQSNQAVSGAGAAVDGGGVTFVDAEIAENVADALDGGLGGGVWCAGCALTFEGGAVRDNVAPAAGGVFVEDGTLAGGAIERNVGTEREGGLVVLGGSVTGVTITENVGSQGLVGGALLMEADLVDSVVTDNQGGGVAIGGGDREIRGCVITGNVSDGAGGGVGVLPAASMRIVGTTIADNVAGVGAGIFSGDLLLTIEGSVVVRNEATQTGGGGVWVARGALTSTGTDWGVGADDNLPDDVYLFGYPLEDVTYAGYTTEAFSCVDQACTPIP